MNARLLVRLLLQHPVGVIGLDDACLLHLDGFSTPDLVSLVERCVAELRENQRRLQTGWMPLFSKLLALLATRDSVASDSDSDGAEEALTGAEYRARLIKILCSEEEEWLPKNFSPMVAMFRDVGLSKDEFERVSVKIRESFSSLDLQSVPPLVYQLLLLCKPFSFAKVLSSLSLYYTDRMEAAFRALEDPATGSEMDTADLLGEDGTAVHEQTMQTVGTVLFHLTQAVGMGHGLHKDVIKLLKAGAHAPEVVLSPFALYLGLCMTSVKACR